MRWPPNTGAYQHLYPEDMLLQFWSARELFKRMWLIKARVIWVLNIPVYQKKKNGSTRRSTTPQLIRTPQISTTHHCAKPRCQVNSVCTLAVVKGTSAWISCQLVQWETHRLVSVSVNKKQPAEGSFTGQEIHSLIVTWDLQLNCYLQTSQSIHYDCTTIKLQSNHQCQENLRLIMFNLDIII